MADRWLIVSPFAVIYYTDFVSIPLSSARKYYAGSKDIRGLRAVLVRSRFRFSLAACLVPLCFVNVIPLTGL
jgi:hypothetical protein